MKTCQKGFGLLELMVCMVILGVLMQVMFTLFSHSLRTQSALQKTIDNAQAITIDGTCIRLTPNAAIPGTFKVTKVNCN
jgi:prepilin-type N-terminal cleavage/methylation domain-containing protein